MSSLPEVEVLLATYNGARFLREQLDSILAQDYGNIRVLVRDDGSSDGTVEILDQYAKRFPSCFRVMPTSAPTGSAKNNFLLLMKASTAEYICFTDQDDVWLPDKVSRTKQAMDQLESRWGTKAPLLVFTDLHVVDDKLTILHKSFWAHMNIDPDRMDRLAALMVQSVVTGCTAMLNRPLLELSLRMPDEAFMHDRWIGLLASSMGKSSGVRVPTVLYRQHEHNVLGTGRGAAGVAAAKPTRSLLERLRRPRISEGQIFLWNLSQRETRAFLQEYGADLPAAKRDLLRAFLRCQTSRSRLVRIATFLRYGFYYVGLRLNLAIMLHLWKMNPDGR
jgi:glycosyltransferase involved in cell wall biosynthesis